MPRASARPSLYGWLRPQPAAIEFKKMLAPRSDEDNEEQPGKPFVLFVSSWFYFLDSYRVRPANERSNGDANGEDLSLFHLQRFAGMPRGCLQSSASDEARRDRHGRL